MKRNEYLNKFDDEYNFVLLLFYYLIFMTSLRYFDELVFHAT